MPTCSVGARLFSCDCPRIGYSQSDRPLLKNPVLKERIKVDGKAGNLGDKVSVQKEGEGKISVTSSAATSKRYIKYLCVLDGFLCFVLLMQSR